LALSLAKLRRLRTCSTQSERFVVTNAHHNNVRWALESDVAVVAI
jgi:hypothetical protein